MKKKTKFNVSFNSPVVIWFTLICLAALGLGWATKGWTTNAFFSVYRSSLVSPLTYVRFVGHVFGHAGWEHFIGNIMMLLIVGPLLEEKYGSSNIVFVILATALVTGIVHFLFFPHVQLLGASGVVFAFILLSPFTSVKQGSIPLTLILVAVLYIGGQIYSGIITSDNISQLTHILGGCVGAGLGYVMHKNKMNRY
ncbi:MAG: rhomboid family intramembrane serine protease [Lachnospiraceae bacterium]|nr:rhomboid family intramembrane serine protease [Lachnospiraceae bacterium]MDE7029281.1 rhomboid family intramembrane serine protease [Lachnospiraceae bacterium]